MKSSKGRFRRLKRIVAWGAGAMVVLLAGAFAVAYVRSTNECETPRAAAPANPIKAIVYCTYGTADVLRLEDVEKPAPAANQALIRVRAASVNPYDWHMMRGKPFLARMAGGLRVPETVRFGVDFAGVVEAVGSDVTDLKPGQEVFGGRTGAFGQYLAARADRLALKPAHLTFEQTAAIPTAGLTALQALRDKGKLQPGQKVLINGASGGVGTFAVQIAKSLGAEVTGVCSTRNVELVRSLGADRVVDYTKDDFTSGATQYDVIMDNVGNRSLSDIKRILKPGGKYVLIGGSAPDDTLALGLLAKVGALYVGSKFGNRDMGMMLAQQNREDLTHLANLIQSGKVTPVIDRRYTFKEVPDAIRYVETGRARGKVVVTID